MKIQINKKETVEATITLTGSPECVRRILTLLAMIETNGGNGHSGTFGISWDGDGNDKISINGIEDVKKESAEGIRSCSEYGAYAEVVGENNSFYIIKGKDINTKRVM